MGRGLALSLLMLAAPALADDEVERLKALVPVLTGKDEGVVVEGRFLATGDFGFSFRLGIGKGGRVSLVVGNLHDGCPLFIGYDGWVVWLDPEKGKILRADGLHPTFLIRARGPDTDLEWGFTTGHGCDEDLRVDLKSFLAMLSGLEVENLAGAGFRLSGRSESGSVCAMRIDEASGHAQVILVKKGGADARFEVRIRKGEVAPVPRLRIPVELVNRTAIGWLDVLTSGLVVCGAVQPRARDEIDAQLQRKVPWADAEASYRRLQPELIRQFGRGPAIGRFRSGILSLMTGKEEEAIADLEAAASDGDARAMFALGEHARDKGRPPDEAVRWYERAADLEHADAQDVIGWMYMTGEGAPRDDTRALAWLRRAVAHEHPRAQVSLGWVHANGRGVPRDDAEAARWFRRSADQGHPEGQRALAKMYLDGLGVERDLRSAFDWFRSAAAQRDAKAQVQLARMYVKGEGTERDPEQAAHWASEAACQDDVDGMTMLAALLGGVEAGVETDMAAAKSWARKAAMRGHFAAQAIYAGLLVRTGEVTEGFAWATLTAESGDRRFVELREQLAGVLTPEQRAESERILARLRDELKGNAGG